ncbi:hypothetical protein D3C73_1473780 [compost metagenome]
MAKIFRRFHFTVSRVMSRVWAMRLLDMAWATRLRISRSRGVSNGCCPDVVVRRAFGVARFGEQGPVSFSISSFTYWRSGSCSSVLASADSSFSLSAPSSSKVRTRPRR